jgi:hypothetical protein
MITTLAVMSTEAIKIASISSILATAEQRFLQMADTPNGRIRDIRPAAAAYGSDGGSFIRTVRELPRFDKGLPEKHSTIWRRRPERWRRWWCGELGGGSVRWGNGCVVEGVASSYSFLICPRVIYSVVIG